MNIKGILENGIAAFLPVYDDGNVTWVFTSDGKQILIRKTCKTFLKNLARFYGVDLVAVREHYGKAINKKQGVPIPMTVNLLLIPVKARKNPLGKNDGTLGYVNFREIKQVVNDKAGKCHINFQCDKDIVVLVSQTTMKEYMKNARLVEGLFLNQHFNKYKGAVHRSWEELQESGSEYNAGVYPPKKAALDELKARMFPWESFYGHNDALLREYLLKLLIDIIHMQKNQAIK